MKHFNKMGKRGLALFLSLVMVIGMLNLTVFAAETPAHTHSQDGWTCTQAEGTKTLDCTTPEHTHEEACYTTENKLICEQEEAEAGHIHDADCCDEEGALICEEEEFLGHAHGSECYAEESALTCETEEHTHDETCYTVTEGAWTCIPPVSTMANEPVTVSDLAGLQAALAEAAPGSTIQVSSTIVISTDTTLDLNGCTIEYVGDKGSVLHVTTGTLTLNDSVGTGKITGGKGTLIQKTDGKWYLGGVEVVDGAEKTPTYNGYNAVIAGRQGVTCGGAILLTNSGKLVMNGGAIDRNTAAMGGGICAFRSAVVEVYGGSVTYNTATTWGGGGMFLGAKNNVIDPTRGSGDILIDHNRTDTTGDLGGGGVFLDSYGSLKIINAVIHDNDADGMGGGVAGCLHGMVSNLSPDTAAIYGNTADGTATLNNIVDHDGYTYKDSNGKDKDEKVFETWDAELNGTSAADYFVAGFSTIGSRSLGGGSAKWEGYAMARPATIANPKGPLVNWKPGATPNKTGEIKDEDPIVVQGLLGLHVTNPDEVAAAVTENNAHKVYITNNHSGMHGGGVGTNGLLTFGEQSYSYSASKLTIKASKDVIDPKNETMREGYTFNLCHNGVTVAAADSDENGVITFKDLSASALFGTEDKNGEVTATLTLEEEDDGKTGMTYDTAKRTIELTATREVSNSIVVTTHGGGNHVSVKTFTDTITKATVKVDGKDQEIEADVSSNVVTLKDAANFTNEMKYADLMVTKSVDYNQNVSQKPDSTEFTIKVQLGGETATTAREGNEYVGDGIYTLKVTAGPDQAGAARITGIPVGTAFRVTEESVPADFALSGITPENGLVSVADENKIGASVTVENRYFKSVETEVTVTKTWANQDETMPVPDSITVKLLQDGEEFDSADVKVDSDGNWTYTFTGLPKYKTENEEFKYTVEEVSVTYGDTVFKVDENGIIEVKGDEKNDDGLSALKGAFMSKVEEFVITNTWTMAGNEGEADLIVRKVAEDGKTPLNGAVFTLTDKDGKVVATKTTDGVTYNLGAPNALGTAMFTFGWDDVGEYTLTETAAPENYKVGAVNQWKVIVTREIASVEKVESSASFINHWTVNVQVVDVNTDKDGDTFLMEVANERRTGELTIGKTVNGADGERSREWNFTVTLTRPEAEPWIVVAGEYPVEYDNSDRENGNVALEEADGVYTMKLTLKHGETATIKGLPVGLEYTVEEAEANTNSYTTTVTLNGQQVPVDEVKGAIPVGEKAETDAVDVVVFNNYREYYRPTRGSLQIIKTVSGGGDEAARKVFTFVVTGPNGYSETVTIIGAGTARLGNLVPGRYTVSESDAAISGYTWTVSGDGKADATVSAGLTATVRFENTYTDEPEESETPAPSEPVPEESDVPETPVPSEPDEEIDEPDVPTGDRPSEPAEPSEPDEEIDEPDVPLGPASPEPDEEIDEPDVPLGPASPEPDEEIGEPDVPTGEVPQTGDSIALWLIVTLVSGAGLVGVALSGKRKKDKEA